MVKYTKSTKTIKKKYEVMVILVFKHILKYNDSSNNNNNNNNDFAFKYAWLMSVSEYVCRGVSVCKCKCLFCIHYTVFE